MILLRILLLVLLVGARGTWQLSHLAALYDKPVTYLNASAGPYIAEHDVIVGRHARLVIEAGTTLQFAKGKELVVFGVLDARGNSTHRIKFTKRAQAGGSDSKSSHRDENRKLRLVSGDTVLDGNLQVYLNDKWNYVCSTQFNWTYNDANVTCKSLGFSNGTFYSYTPATNLTSHLKIFAPKCTGHEKSLFDCVGTSRPEQGLSVCERLNVVSLHCEGFDNDLANEYDNWAGLVFQRHAPYTVVQQYSALFTNISQSVLECVDVEYAGLSVNRQKSTPGWYGRPHYDYRPGSAVTVFQYGPTLRDLKVRWSLGNGLNFSNVEAPVAVHGGIFEANRVTRFGNVKVLNTHSKLNMGDGLKYVFNNTAWSLQEQQEKFISNRYIEFCDSQNPLSYPAYYRFRNPNYVTECSKTFSTEDQALRITLHFQEVNIRSQFSKYWLEVYDGQTDQNPLIANYTFEDGKTPESVYSRSNYMFVKIRFQCSYNETVRHMQPVELRRLEQMRKWDQFKKQQYIYEKNLYKYNQPDQRFDKNRIAERPWETRKDEYVAPLSLSKLTFQDTQNALNEFELSQRKQAYEFNIQLEQEQQKLRQARVYCPFANFDDISMFAMIGHRKDPDLVVKDSAFVANAHNGLNATSLRSLVEVNGTRLNANQLNGMQIHAGAGDVSMSHCQVEENAQNGVNVTYAGGLKEFNYTSVSRNALFGIYVSYDVEQRMDNIFQNTTLNGSWIEENRLGGVFLGGYCNQSNITVNATSFVANRQDGLTIESCQSASGVDWYYIEPLDRLKFQPKYFWYKEHWLNKTIHYAHVNVSWSLFARNRLNGLKMVGAQNLDGIITNNTFTGHAKGACLIAANQDKLSDTLVRNMSLKIQFNTFTSNSGRYALNVALNNLVTDRQIQEINITFNRFENNTIYDAFQTTLNARSSKSAVAVVSGTNVRLNQNWFDNPLSKVQIATALTNSSSRINASHNWFNQLEPVYDLNYFFTYRDKCNQQWRLVRSGVFDQANRSNLAQIVYYPYSCNEKLWFHEVSSDLRPPREFKVNDVMALGGILDLGIVTLPAQRYTVTNDILVAPNSKLVLKPGTELNFLNGVGMTVLGELVVDGVQSSEVRFSLADQHVFNGRQSVEYQERMRTFLSSTKRMPAAGELSANGNSTSINVDNSTLSSEDPLSDSYYTQTRIDHSHIELVDGRDAYEGRLIVHVDGTKGTVCNRAWTLQNSKLVCQQLGLIVDPDLYFYRVNRQSHGHSEPIVMSEVQCDSLDTDLMECRYTAGRDQTCTHEDDVWIKCLRPGWAGVHFGLHAVPSSIRYGRFEGAGQYDYERGDLAAAIRLDLNKHLLTNLTFTQNEHTSLEVVFNEPFLQGDSTTQHQMAHRRLDSLEFIANRGIGLLTRTSFLAVNQLRARDNWRQPAVEYNPFFSVRLLDELRIQAQDSRRGHDVRKEVTRLHNSVWHIGRERMVMLYTDTEYNFGPRELNIQIQTDNNRVLVVELIDYNPDFSAESVTFCEKFCQQDYQSASHKQWNLSVDSASMHFPINTSYSALHINYNVTNLKSGRLTFLVWSVPAPEPVFDYKKPSYIYIRDIMPPNRIVLNNSTFVKNRHAVVMRHYDDAEDTFGNLRRRYNYSNVIVANSTFDSNDQLLWINTDPVIPNTHYKRSDNVSFHREHGLDESQRDDALTRETGYELYDLVPKIKQGPIGRVNITFENSLVKNNYGGMRFLYRYHEYSNSLWHFEIRNNKFANNKQSLLRLLMPRIHQFSRTNHWLNTTHSVNIRHNEFTANSLFELSVTGFYAQVNITKNIFAENTCRAGLLRFTGTEKTYFIYKNLIEGNLGRYVMDMEAHSHASYVVTTPSLFVENILQYNHRLADTSSHGNNNNNLDQENAPHSYTLAVRGIQNCTFTQNSLENPEFKYELVGAMSTRTLNSTVDALGNWWGTGDADFIGERIFDINEWNDHARVNFVPFCVNRHCDSLSRVQPSRTAALIENMNMTGQFMLAGLIERDITLRRTPVPYQVNADLTVMPGATLFIEQGVEMEFYPNVGILVLGHLKASGSIDSPIKMRPVRKFNNRVKYFSDSGSNNPYETTPKSSSSLNTDLHGNNNNNGTTVAPAIDKNIRLFSGLKSNEGFLQIYNATLREWTWLCDDQFNLYTGSVACRQLGMESRNVLVKSVFYYTAPWESLPIWNQTFICSRTQQQHNSLQECDTFANYQVQHCTAKARYIYLMCNEYAMADTEYAESWGGVRFAKPYFEPKPAQAFMDQPLNKMPIYVKPDLLAEEEADDSYMNHVHILGAGKLHGERSPAVALIYRAPFINNCNITLSNYHGIEFVQPKSTVTANNLQIHRSNGYAVNTLLLNTQTTDQRSSFQVLPENTLSSSGAAFGLIDICDPHKFYEIDQRVLVFYKYSNEARDCSKIFRTRISSSNLGVTGQIGLRLLQFMLANNTVQNDTLDLYDALSFEREHLMRSLSNGSGSAELETFYLSKSDSLTLLMKASVGQEYHGFIAEVLVYPTSQYLPSENYVEISDSQFTQNQLGVLQHVSAGERNPSFYLLRNRLVNNGHQLFNSTSGSLVRAIVQNTPKLHIGNNYIAHNFGGMNVKLYSGSGVLITSSVVFNNVFKANRNDTILCVDGELELPYNELVVDKNIFLDNQTPRTNLIYINALLSKFTRNQVLANEASHILYTHGFENVSTPRSQETAFNLFKSNYAHGMINDLTHANRFRSTLVAGSLKQSYHANYFFNPLNDFELTALEDPLALAYLAQLASQEPGREEFFYWDDVRGKMIKKERYVDIDSYDARLFNQASHASHKPKSLQGLIAFTGALNATYNYWGTSIDTEMRARIRDKYDSATLFEVAYSPSVADKFELRDGKCELGWSLIEDTCYTYAGAHATYDEAASICRRFDARLARETIAPIRLPQFRKLARTSQFNYDVQSYRRMWLHTDHMLNGDRSMCTTIQDYGRSSAKCAHLLPFICEKDPFFHGAHSFRFKDEIAFAIAASGALVVCVLILAMLWLAKSTRRKKQHFERQQTLRSSARSHRHMINQSGTSNYSRSLSSQAHLYNGTTTSIDNLSSTYSSTTTRSTRPGANGCSDHRSNRSGIYASQRNQYFASKKHKSAEQQLAQNGTATEPKSPSKIVNALREIEQGHAVNHSQPLSNNTRNAYDSGGFFPSDLDRHDNNLDTSNQNNFPRNNSGNNNNSMRNIRNQHHKDQQHQLNRSTESIISEETTEDANSTLHIIENHQSQRNHNHLRPTRLPQDQKNMNNNYNEYSESNTTTDELTDEGNFTSTNFSINNNNMNNQFRDSTGFQTFNNAQTSSAEFSINTTDTYTDPLKSPQVSPPAKQSTPNLSSNRHNNNNNIQQSPKNKHEIRFKTKNSSNSYSDQLSSLLASKVQHNMAPLVDPHLESLTSGSLVSNTNLTNISPLNSINLNSSVQQPPSLTSLSPAVPLTFTKQNFYHQDNSSSASSLQTSRLVRPSDVPPAPPHSNIPPLPSQIALRKLKANESLPTSDAESTISCQLITSSSLLLNRDFVKQASLVRLDANGRPLPPPKTSHQTQTNNELFCYASQAAESSTDATKPPPMETCI